MSHTTIVWFRRDLRIRDNPAFAAAARRGRVVPVYIGFEGDENSESPGAASKWWLHHSLLALKKQLASRGISLIFSQGPTLRALRRIIKQSGADAVYWNRLYEPMASSRDANIAAALSADGCLAESFNGSLLYEPGGVRNNSGGPFKVFTPFWRKACQKEPRRPIGAPRVLKGAGKRLSSCPLEFFGFIPAANWHAGMKPYWEPGEAGARKALSQFIAGAGTDYSHMRNIPGAPGTSRLSPHLHFGELSPNEVWWRYSRGGVSPENQGAFLGELGWREFAHHILANFPYTVKNPLNARFKRFPWRRSARDFNAWRRGKTGYPIVDAGMRELWKTGWMHNRVRMIVASFLVKHLGLEWKKGGGWFWDTLVDADLAANTLGWQWSAGCGADAAPYFRIFNPTLQGEKFDKAGKYVRRWVPELKAVEDRWVHRPWEAPVGPKGYPKPIVSHDVARKRALALYARWRSASE